MASLTENDIPPIRGVLLDFYGTVVMDDSEAILSASSGVLSETPSLELAPADLAALWMEEFFTQLQCRSGQDFLPQQTIQVFALERVMTRLDVRMTPSIRRRIDVVFDYWRSPSPFGDGVEFVRRCAVPICVVSNVDRSHLASAIAAIGLDFFSVLTSEDVRSYKPRPELFLAGLEQLRLDHSEVIHIGDSLVSDVQGAQALGIRAAWVNRSSNLSRGRPHNILEINSLLELLGSVVPVIDRDAWQA